MSLQLCLAQPSQLGALCALERACFGADALPALVIRQNLDLFGDRFFVASDGGAPLGFCTGGRGSTGSWILGLGVRPEARRRGLAAALLERTLSSFDPTDGTIRATIEPSNTPSLAVFRRCGFVQEAVVQDYFGPGEPRVVVARMSPG